MNWQRLASLILLAALAASKGGWPSAMGLDERKDTAITAKEILEKLNSVYLNCKSYRDSGRGKSVFTNSVSESVFDTVFVRPDKFRFATREYFQNKEMAHIVVWQNGQKFLFSGPSVRGLDNPDSLNKGMAAVAGASNLRANIIRALLLPKDIEALPRTGIIEDPKRIDDASLGKVECFRISGTFHGHSRTVWIEKKRSLIRRIDTKWELKKGSREDTITYDPEIDIKIPEEMLEFDRKEKKE